MMQKVEMEVGGAGDAGVSGERGELMRGFSDRTRAPIDGITAKQLVREVGAKKLIGKRIMTPTFGSYPGGPATITKVGRDPTAPDIAFLVEHDTWRDGDGSGVMGVFGYEVVRLI